MATMETIVTLGKGIHFRECIEQANGWLVPANNPRGIVRIIGRDRIQKVVWTRPNGRIASTTIHK